MPLQHAADPCALCNHADWPLDQTLAALPYAYPWVHPIRQFKFHEHTGFAHSFARLMRRDPLLVQCLESADCAVPMPLSDTRLRSRGFNQSLLLARALCHDRVRTHLLVRTRDTPAQSSLRSEERWRNVRHAYQAAAAGDALAGLRIVLIDDVMTTGASLCSAATALRQAGAAHVSAVVLARAE